MRAATLLALAACVGCGVPTPAPDAGTPRRFHDELPPSSLNGVWQAVDAGRPLGVIIYELPGGAAWSPHGLLIASANAWATHDCRDFRVDASSGVVIAAVGTRAAGRVELNTSTGARLEWELTPGWASTLSAAFGWNPANSALLTLDARLGIASLRLDVARSGDTMDAQLEAVWQAAPVDGGTPRVVQRDTSTLRLTRTLRCE